MLKYSVAIYVNKMAQNLVKDKEYFYEKKIVVHNDSVDRTAAHCHIRYRMQQR